MTGGPDARPFVRLHSPWRGSTVALCLFATIAAMAALAGCGAGAPKATAQRTTSRARPTRSRAAAPTPATATPSADAAAAYLSPPTGPSGLAPGSDPSALPGPILIADKNNNRLLIVDPQGRVRWEFPRPGDLAPGQTFRIPDDAFFSPDGKEIIATEEDDYVISLIDIATHRITYRYGHPGTAGSSPGYLDNPDDAMVLPGGDILTADIKNCRILLIGPGATAPARILGGSSRGCVHGPPAAFGSPNGAFPMRDGNYLVTEINGSWVDAMSLSGVVAWTVHPPHIAYPSDTNEVSADRYLTVDYSTPGQVLIFDRAGNAIWRYAPRGAPAALSHPSLALPLPNGDVLLNDDFDHRVIVIDPTTDKIVWQYGHDGVAGTSVGYLNNPDGLDLLPPHSLLATHAATMGAP